METDSPTTDHQRVLDFWFGELDGDGLADDAHRSMWFRKDEKLDQRLRDEFSSVHRALASGGMADWLESPRGRLAAVIVLDQLSRNMFRDRAEMFAYDQKALELCKKALARGDAETLAVSERSFLYMPLMHSESLEDQELCVKMFSELRDQLEGRAQKQIAQNVDYAIRHRDIIARFGRFPHRNAILGRESTAEETAFLKQPNSSF
jgi:uncharacterized protein (DUF924 family)